MMPLNLGSEPPWSRDAEKAVLGTVMVYPETYSAISLEPQDFFLPMHRELWEAMHELHKAERPADAIAVMDRMKIRGDKNVEPAYLMECCQLATSPDMLAHHASLVTRDSARRRLMFLAADMYTHARSDGDVDQLTADARIALDGISANAGGPVRVGDRIAAVIDSFEARRNRPHENSVPTGLRAFDRIIGPLRPGRVIVVAARPGIGKSSLMRAFALHGACRLGIPTLIFSLEVTTDELIEQFISAKAQVASERLDRGEISQDEYAAIYHAQPALAEAPLYVDDRMMTAAQVDATARRWRAQQSAPIVQIWIDYLGLLSRSGSNRRENREQQVAGDSWTLKRLAKDCKCPVGVVVQLSRDIEKRGPDAEPKLSDLRESGSIEQDAHQVMFVERKPPLNESGPASLIVGKNRGGRVGRIPMQWVAQYTTFMDQAGEHEYAHDARTGPAERED